MILKIPNETFLRNTLYLPYSATYQSYGKFSRECNDDIHFLLWAMHLKKPAKNLIIEQHLYEYKCAPRKIYFFRDFIRTHLCASLYGGIGKCHQSNLALPGAPCVGRKVFSLDFNSVLRFVGLQSTGWWMVWLTGTPDMDLDKKKSSLDRKPTVFVYCGSPIVKVWLTPRCETWKAGNHKQQPVLVLPRSG